MSKPTGPLTCQVSSLGFRLARGPSGSFHIIFASTVGNVERAFLGDRMLLNAGCCSGCSPWAGLTRVLIQTSSLTIGDLFGIPSAS